MKDFHDAKDLFKAIHELYKNNEGLQALPNSWRDNHIYVIDYFLWFMGQHGYKLQKIRSGIQFFDINKTISEMRDKRMSDLNEILLGINKETKQQ